MPQPHQTELNALRNLVTEAYNILDTIELPEGRAVRARELLRASIALTNDLLAQPAAAALGSKGGKRTAERGPEYYAKIAAMRKTRAGGRPRKSSA